MLEMILVFLPTTVIMSFVSNRQFYAVLTQSNLPLRMVVQDDCSIKTANRGHDAHSDLFGPNPAVVPTRRRGFRPKMVKSG